MHYHTNRRLINARITSFTSELERALLHTLLAGVLWTAVRAYQQGLITSPLCPYCKATDETEEHILWHCTAWAQARDTHIQQSACTRSKNPGASPLSGVAPLPQNHELSPGPPAPINRQVEQHDLPFIPALHTMFVSVLAARKKHHQNTPRLFPKARVDSARAYPCQQLVGPLPRPPETPVVSLHNPTKRTWPWEVSFITDLLRWLRALQ